MDANSVSTRSGHNHLISIIIPHWNGIEILSECLESLKKSATPDCEIIVVDNASTDGSAEWIRTHHPDVVLVENEINRGYAGGCNSGADIARGKYILFLNNDTIHEPNWLTPLTKAMESDPDLAAVQPKIRNYFERELFDYAGGSGGEMDIFVYPFARGRIFQSQEKDEGQYNQSTGIFWASGTAFMVRADLFNQAGRFDESFFAHMEEIDLCWRFHLMGKRVAAVPESVIYHRNAVTLNMYSYQKYFLNHRNSLMLLCSNYSFPVSIYLFPLRFALEWVALLYSIVLRDWNHFRAILAALGWIVVHPGRIIARRKKMRSLRKISDRQVMGGMFRGSIVWAYYILGRKTYSSLVRPK